MQRLESFGVPVLTLKCPELVLYIFASRSAFNSKMFNLCAYTIVETSQAYTHVVGKAGTTKTIQ